VDEGRGSSLFRHPSTALTLAPSPHGEGFPSLFEAVDSATPGKPSVTGGRLQTVGEGLGRALSVHPSSAMTRTPILKGEGFFTFESVDSATPGKPFVQNDMLEAMRMCYQVLET